MNWCMIPSSSFFIRSVGVSIDWSVCLFIVSGTHRSSSPHGDIVGEKSRSYVDTSPVSREQKSTVCGRCARKIPAVHNDIAFCTAI